MGLLPIGLVSFDKLDPFMVVCVGLYSWGVVYGFRKAFVSKDDFAIPSRVVLLIILTLVVSYVFMIINHHKYITWIIYWCLGYATFWVVISEVKRASDIELLLRIIGIMASIGMIWALFFFLVPSVLRGPLRDAGMGSFRAYEDGIPRIFTPVMHYTALGILYVACRAIVLRRRLSLRHYLFGLFALLELLVVFSIRTDIIDIGLLLIGIFFLSRRKNKIRTFITFTAAGVLLMGSLYFLLPARFVNYVSERTTSVMDLSAFDLSGALTPGVLTYGNSEYWTFYWRIREVFYALDFVDTPQKMMFGDMGEKYDFEGVDDEIAPHNSYFGIFFLFGYLGVFVFASFLLYFSRQIWHLLKKFQDSKEYYLAVFLAVSWVFMLILNFSGGFLYSPDGCLIYATIAGLSSVMSSKRFMRSPHPA